MLNPIFKGMYSDIVLDKMKKFADDMEKENRRVIVCFTEESNGMMYPGYCFIEDMSDMDSIDLVQNYIDFRWIMKVSGDPDAAMIVGNDLRFYEEADGGYDLWVK